MTTEIAIYQPQVLKLARFGLFQLGGAGQMSEKMNIKVCPIGFKPTIVVGYKPTIVFG